MTEDEMVGWYPGLNGHEFKQALGVGDGQVGLAGYGPRGHRESDTTERMSGDVDVHHIIVHAIQRVKANRVSIKRDE